MAKNQLFFSDKQTGARYGVGRGTVWKWVKDGAFPRPVKLSPGCTRWRLDDLLKWERKPNTMERAVG